MPSTPTQDGLRKRGVAHKPASAAGPTAAKAKSVPDTRHFWRHLIIFIGLAALGATGVVLFFKNAPTLEGNECDGVGLKLLVTGPIPKFVGGGGDLAGTTTRIWHCAEAYQKDHPTFVLGAFIIMYVSLQTFAIPGPIVLSVISGALYDAIPAQLLVAACATTGASLCFTISYFIGNDIVNKLIPGPIANFRAKTEANKNNIMNYLLFLRLTPLLPNWFVNVASPICGVPLWKFFLATLVGLVPANYFHCQTGRTLASMNGFSVQDNGFKLVLLMVLQFIPLLPTLFKKRLARMEQEKFGAGSNDTKTDQ